MKQSCRTSKVWVVYAYDPGNKCWDELDYSIHYRKLKYIFRTNYLSTKAINSGYTKFILVRRCVSSLFHTQRNSGYNKYFSSGRVRDLLNRLVRYETSATHTDRTVNNLAIRN